MRCSARPRGSRTGPGDAIWGSAGRIDDQGYTVEVAIPFKSLRFPRTAGGQTWGFILERSYPRSVRRRIQSAPRDPNNTCLLCEANKVTGFPGIAPGRNIGFDPAATLRPAELPT